MTQKRNIGAITSPEVSEELVSACADVMERAVAVRAITVEARNEFHPYRAKVVGEDGYLRQAVEVPAGTSTNRQDLAAAYFRDGYVEVWQEDEREGKVVCLRKR